MSSIIQFKVISGAYNDSPLCYLLQIDEYKFLLDCGWNENFDLEIIEEYKKIVKSVDAVLISYPDLKHIGALPYLVGKCGLNCPIYATVPVFKMGQMFMYDIFLSRSSNEDFDLFTLDDIDASFEKMQQLKYSQTISLKGKGQGLQITPLPGGHVIGGTIWKILKEGEEEIIYAVDYNHHKERHLNGCVLDSISKPTLLITDSYNFLYSQVKRRNRDAKLLECILKTLRNDGNVLVCIDTAGRVLELAYFLDQLWKNENSGMSSYSIALLNYVSISVIEFAKSQVEWMNDKIVQSFEVGRYNPFDFKHIKLCQSLSELNQINSPSRNKLVLASTPDLQCGFSRNLFAEWCENPKNTIIFTEKSSSNTLAYSLIEDLNKKFISLEMHKRVKLEGKELEDHYFMEMEKEKEKQERIKKSKELESIDESESSDEESGTMNIDSMIVPQGKHDLMKIQENKNRFFKHSRKQFPIFPCKEETVKWDEYGEFIKVEDYMLTNELDNKIILDADGNPIPNLTASDILANDLKNTNLNGEHEAAADIPTKCIKETFELNIKAKLMYIDYEGKSDGESIKKLLSNIKPKNLIIVHGDEKSTKEMSEFCKNQQIVQDRIFTPRIGEIADATTETQIYHVKLKDELVSSLQFQKVKDYELAWVDAVLKTRNTQADKEKQVALPTTGFDLGFSLHPQPKDDSHSRKTVFVNEPKLSDLKHVFVQNSIQAEFHGGVLVCNGIIALRKVAGRIIMEGVVSDDYYRVRKILYAQYAIL